MIWNKHQEAIFEHVRNGNRHAMVDAVAGSGKTTTIVKALESIAPEADVLFVAFNRHIAAELKKRVPFNCEATTLNSLGYGITRKAFGFTKIKETKTEDILWFDVFGSRPENRRKYYKSLRVVRQLVGLFKAYAITEPTVADCDFFADRYTLLNEPEDGEYELAMRTLALGLKQKKVMDFDDQIYYPLAFDLTCPQYDYVFVDESQDLNPAQVALVRRVCHKAGMIVAVGDTNQAIYGFRGADPEAMGSMSSALNMVHLPLSVCYRCAKNIVIAAQEEVPHIEYCETAEEGVVAHIPAAALLDRVEPGDFILCRTTAPLVEYVMAFIRERRKAYIRGRDFGQNLIALLAHIDDLDGYEEKMQKALSKKPAALLTTQDQIDTMRILMGMYGDDSHEIKRAIEEIFDNDGVGIMLSTVHRCKGLETDRVFLIRPDLVPHPKATLPWMIEQEHNLHYIAITRAKKEFYYVDASLATIEPNTESRYLMKAADPARLAQGMDSNEIDRHADMLALGSGHSHMLSTAFDSDEDSIDWGEDAH